MTQSGEQTTSSNEENILYSTVHITAGLFFNDLGYFWLSVSFVMFSFVKQFKRCFLHAGFAYNSTLLAAL